ncbi:hypothetical protein [Nonomuraea candida]|uniref:hypothetical protein n=1 Tax=Nonomuraea candida TaxID=359159 RepID=UPI001B802DF9|nr:hypothetical protein [Nonomuraea candida]
MRVLLVEDEQPLARYIEAGLRKHGFTVDVALDGQSALDECELVPYEVVVLDRTCPWCTTTRCAAGSPGGAAVRIDPNSPICSVGEC